MNQRNDDMIARGNVVVRGSNSTIRTEELHYDPTRNLVTSDKPTEINQQGNVIRGQGVESDPALTNIRIRGGSAVLRSEPGSASSRGAERRRIPPVRRDPRPSRFILFALLVLAAADSRTRAGGRRLVVIDHANELRRVVEGDSLTYFLQGAVRAHRGPIQMRSEQASIFRQSQVADFQRNVHFWDATTEIYADRLLYYEVSNQALATGSVQVIDRRSGSQVAADTFSTRETWA